MRHRRKAVKLGRDTGQRRALLASLVCNLVAQKRIRTTLAKAKVARALAEKMVTLGKQGTLSARRRAIAIMRRPELVAELFEKIAPQYKERHGGYTRIVKLGLRGSDSSEMALLEWVDLAIAAKPKSKPKTAKAAEPKAT